MWLRTLKIKGKEDRLVDHTALVGFLSVQMT